MPARWCQFVKFLFCFRVAVKGPCEWFRHREYPWLPVHLQTDVNFISNSDTSLLAHLRVDIKAVMCVTCRHQGCSYLGAVWSTLDRNIAPSSQSLTDVDGDVDTGVNANLVDLCRKTALRTTFSHQQSQANYSLVLGVLNTLYP